MITKIGKEIVHIANLLAKAHEFKYRNLEKYAATRYKELLPGLSPESKTRLSDVVKPLAEELAGIRRGTENMIARAGYTMRPATTDEEINTALGGGGAVNDHKTKTVLYLDPQMLKGRREYRKDKRLIPFYNTARKNYGYVNEGLLRHEAFEADEYTKAKSRGVTPFLEVFTTQNLNKPDMKRWRNGIGITDKVLENQTTDPYYIKRLGSTENLDSFFDEPVGRHVNLKVLAKETEFLNKSFYNHMANSIKNYRRRYGEADILADNMDLDRSRGDIYSTLLTKKDYKNMATPRKNVLDHRIERNSDDINEIYDVHRSTIKRR